LEIAAAAVLAANGETFACERRAALETKTQTAASAGRAKKPREPMIEPPEKKSTRAATLGHSELAIVEANSAAEVAITQLHDEQEADDYALALECEAESDEHEWRE
jgi:hypothetical protein